MKTLSMLEAGLVRAVSQNVGATPLAALASTYLPKSEEEPCGSRSLNTYL